MMPPPNLISVLCDLDLLTPKVDRFIALCQFSAKAVELFSQYRANRIGSKRTEGRIGLAVNIMPPPSVDWRRHINRILLDNPVL